MEAAARSGRILAERSTPDETTREQDVQLDPVEPNDKPVRHPSRRYRKKQPVRFIDPAEYEDRTEIPTSVPTPRMPELMAEKEKAARPEPTPTNQPDNDASPIGYRIRRIWRTGGVALGDRWKVRSGVFRHTNRRRKTDD
ncbi:hypothetical protein [Fulvimarina sp. 2208YS6-2-32]|uniref:hypothetical protein n=1 Tax=Fulvimarina uroteuthidis TaxID=3098149 RepID=UPI002AC954B0|nr:hypothetical protein [Fulvimarina sp. 2208YS6-2-32]